MGPDDIFECTKCGECCKGYGGAFATEKDIHAIGAYLKIDPGIIVSRFCQVSCGKMILGQGEDGYCVFWDGECKIHPVKPRMCRAWPFIKSVLVDVENWRIMADSCPGMRTDISDDIIKACVRKAIRERKLKEKTEILQSEHHAIDHGETPSKQ